SKQPKEFSGFCRQRQPRRALRLVLAAPAAGLARDACERVLHVGTTSCPGRLPALPTANSMAHSSSSWSEPKTVLKDSGAHVGGGGLGSTKKWGLVPDQPRVGRRSGASLGGRHSALGSFARGQRRAPGGQGKGRRPPGVLGNHTVLTLRGQAELRQSAADRCVRVTRRSP